MLVRVLTDEGLVGWGDATTPMTYKPVVAAIEEIGKLCVGRDPLQIERLWESLFTTLYLPDDGTLLSAIAGIETACWDMLGKSLGAPLHQLLGGRVHDRIKAYANGWYSGPRDESAFADKGGRSRRAGISRVEVRPLRIGLPRARPAGKDEEPRDRARRARSGWRRCRSDDRGARPAHSGRGDPHLPRTRGVPTALGRGAGLVHRHGALKTVAEATPLRIVAGERLTNLGDFADLLATRRMDIVQPEYVELGGMHRLRQVAALAEAYQGMIAPHNARCPISTAVNVQVDAATRNVFIQETFDDFHVSWAKDLFTGIPAVEDGTSRSPRHRVSGSK